MIYRSAIRQDPKTGRFFRHDARVGVLVTGTDRCLIFTKFAPRHGNIIGILPVKRHTDVAEIAARRAFLGN